MNVCIDSVKLQCAIVYIENVIIFSKLLKKDMMNIDDVIGLLAAEIELRLKKCRFFPNQLIDLIM